MLITRTSTLSGTESSMEIGVTPEQLLAWENGELIQRAMPNLTPDEREFILNGVTANEWDEFFEEED